MGTAHAETLKYCKIWHGPWNGKSCDDLDEGNAWKMAEEAQKEVCVLTLK